MHFFQDPGSPEAETETAICKRRGNLSSNIFSKDKNALQWHEKKITKKDSKVHLQMFFKLIHGADEIVRLARKWKFHFLFLLCKLL